MPKTIVAIGGGHIRTKATLAIDREIIRLSRKEHPRLLFIPTASSDDEGCWDVAQRYFGDFLKCKTDVLYLIREKPSPRQIREKILSADIIYVGGGNTLLMMRLWRRLGVDKLLRRAYEKGTVLCGVSAGAICWFDSGHSDSISFYNPRHWDYINVKALGFVKGVFCPHYDSTTLRIPRRRHFKDMIGKIGGVGIAVENSCAIEIVDNQYRVIRSSCRARAYRVCKDRRRAIANQIPQQKQWTPYASLFE
jgi:dipeptidase E